LVYLIELGRVWIWLYMSSLRWWRGESSAGGALAGGSGSGGGEIVCPGDDSGEMLR